MNINYIGADVLYMTDNIPNILYTVQLYMNINPQLKFMVTYQDRK